MNCTECAFNLVADRAKYSCVTEGLCFNCWFWLGHVSKVDESESIRIGGVHYRLGNPVWAGPEYKGMLAFYGRKFEIMQGDVMIHTNNLWHQGTIPELFRDRLPDNASHH